MAPAWKRIPALLLLLTALAVAASSARANLRSTQARLHRKESPLYLPKAHYVKLVTLGFDNAASDLIWFNTVNYFGRELVTEKDFTWLYEMCDIITTLDSKAEYLFEFCGTMLSWVAKNAEESNKILDKGVSANPHLWRPRYLRGFNYWYFLNRRDLAREDLRQASLMPGAPTFLASQASRLMIAGNEIDEAIAFLQDLIKQSQNSSGKQALTERLKQAYVSKNMRVLDGIVRRFEETQGRLPVDLDELVRAGMLRSVPEDGFGGTFALDKESGKVVSTTGQKGLEFFGKTSQTGIFSKMKD